MKTWSALVGGVVLAVLLCGCSGEKDRGKYQDQDKPRAADRDEKPKDK
jgi:hypothetical protein